MRSTAPISLQLEIRHAQALMVPMACYHFWKKGADAPKSRIRNGKRKRKNRQKTGVKCTETSRNEKNGRCRESCHPGGEKGRGLGHDPGTHQKRRRRKKKSQVAAVSPPPAVVLRKKWILCRLNGLGSKVSRDKLWRNPQSNLKNLTECAIHQTPKVLNSYGIQFLRSTTLYVPTN